VDALRRDVPELQVIVDPFEQRVQRPQDREEADRSYSGKKTMHTLKSQVAVDGQSGDIVDVPASVPGPTADLTLLKQSGVLGRLPPDCDVGGDLGYPGLDKLHPRGHLPRRKPRGKPRPPEDVAYNQAFARQRVVVEHTLGEVRRFACLTQTDRHRRQQHSARVRAVAGLVYRRRHRHDRRRAASLGDHGEGAGHPSSYSEDELLASFSRELNDPASAAHRLTDSPPSCYRSVTMSGAIGVEAREGRPRMSACVAVRWR
jgi:hypothetical protein